MKDTKTSQNPHNTVILIFQLGHAEVSDLKQFSESKYH